MQTFHIKIFFHVQKYYVNEAIQEVRVLFSINYIQDLTPQTLLLNEG